MATFDIFISDAEEDGPTAGRSPSVCRRNLHVKDQRTYFGLGFSVTRLVETLAQSAR